MMKRLNKLGLSCAKLSSSLGYVSQMLKVSVEGIYLYLHC